MNSVEGDSAKSETHAESANGKQPHAEKDDVAVRVSESPTPMSDSEEDEEEDNDSSSESTTEDDNEVHQNGSAQHAVVQDEEDDEDDAEDEDEDEDEEEPSLKYDRITGDIPDLLRKDSASGVAVSNKRIVCATL